MREAAGASVLPVRVDHAVSDRDLPVLPPRCEPLALDGHDDKVRARERLEAVTRRLDSERPAQGIVGSLRPACEVGESFPVDVDEADARPLEDLPLREESRE